VPELKPLPSRSKGKIMDLANARIDELPVFEVEKEKLRWAVRTLGIRRCLGDYTRDHRILAIGIVALRKQLRSPVPNRCGEQPEDAAMRQIERRLNACRRNMRENKRIIRCLMSLEHLRTKVIDLAEWKRCRY
jgi:hypothetical protein